MLIILTAKLGPTSPQMHQLQNAPVCKKTTVTLSEDGKYANTVTRESIC